MSFCPNCGMENAKTATECRRCHVPLELQAEAAAPEPLAVSSDDLSNQLGEVCRRCESYNEPGTPRCTTCGYKLIPDPGEELEPIEPRQQAGLEEPGHAEPAGHEAAHHEEPAAHFDEPAAHFDEPAYAEPHQAHHDEHAAPAHEAFPEHTPPSPVPAHVAPHNEELAAYAISADEAASAAHVDQIGRAHV